MGSYLKQLLYIVKICQIESNTIEDFMTDVLFGANQIHLVALASRSRCQWMLITKSKFVNPLKEQMGAFV